MRPLAGTRWRRRYPNRVVVLLVRVMSSIDLYDEIVLTTHEVHNVPCRSETVCETCNSSSDGHGVSTRVLVRRPWTVFSSVWLWILVTSPSPLVSSTGQALRQAQGRPSPLPSRERGKRGGGVSRSCSDFVRHRQLCPSARREPPSLRQAQDRLNLPPKGEEARASPSNSERLRASYPIDREAGWS